MRLAGDIIYSVTYLEPVQVEGEAPLRPAPARVLVEVVTGVSTPVHGGQNRA